ncbi:hypothetical protein Ciccas_001564 [Cichlidogyrus casuarinus]|uniref:Ig-like domain-containing protein n=1 Tax=Cichlidogyrus casuarinus TaxID=1844966 RepID=A0ABD2QJN5_9PLAT
MWSNHFPQEAHYAIAAKTEPCPFRQIKIAELRTISAWTILLSFLCLPPVRSSPLKLRRVKNCYPSCRRREKQRWFKILNKWIYWETLLLLLAWFVVTHVFSSLLLHVAFHNTHVFVDAKLSNELLRSRMPAQKGSALGPRYPFNSTHHGARHLSLLKGDPGGSVPCTHEFMTFPDNLALVSDIVLVGTPQGLEPFGGSSIQPKLLAFINVKLVLKRPTSIAFPLRNDYNLLASYFAKSPEYVDQGRCLFEIQINRTYIFYLHRATNKGIYPVSQMPTPYNQNFVRQIKVILYGSEDPGLNVNIMPISHDEKLKVLEDQDVELLCKVTGKPLPIITWTHNDDPITVTDTGPRVDHRNS